MRQITSSELECMEVINMCDGGKLGYPSAVELCVDDGRVTALIIPRDSGDFSVIMSLDDEVGNLMTLELVAPDQRQAVRLSKLFENKAENVYNLTMTELLDEEDELDD